MSPKTTPTKAPAPIVEPEPFQEAVPDALNRLDAFRDAATLPASVVESVEAIPDEIAQAVYDLRVAGKSEESIARTANLPVATVAALVQRRAQDRILREVRPLQTDVMLEIDRLDQMLEAIWPQVQSGDIHAVDRALKIGIERRALKGLDAPTVKATLNLTLTDEGGVDFDRLGAEELRQLKGLLEKARAPKKKR